MIIIPNFVLFVSFVVTIGIRIISKVRDYETTSAGDVGQIIAGVFFCR